MASVRQLYLKSRHSTTELNEFYIDNFDRNIVASRFFASVPISPTDMVVRTAFSFMTYQVFFLIFYTPVPVEEVRP